MTEQKIDLQNRVALRPREVATVSGLSRARVYELIKAGTLPAVRVEGTILVPVDTLRAWLGELEPVASVVLDWPQLTPRKRR
jgi:excisionase family DNA binding protein